MPEVPTPLARMLAWGYCGGLALAGAVVLVSAASGISWLQWLALAGSVTAVVSGTAEAVIARRHRRQLERRWRESLMEREDR